MRNSIEPKRNINKISREKTNRIEKNTRDVYACRELSTLRVTEVPSLPRHRGDELLCQTVFRSVSYAAVTAFFFRIVDIIVFKDDRRLNCRRRKNNRKSGKKPPANFGRSRLLSIRVTGLGRERTEIGAYSLVSSVINGRKRVRVPPSRYR